MGKPNTAIVYCNGVEQKRENINPTRHEKQDKQQRIINLRRLHESVRKVAERNPQDICHIDLKY